MLISQSKWICPGELAEGVTPGVGALDRVPGVHVSCCKSPMANGVKKSGPSDYDTMGKVWRGWSRGWVTVPRRLWGLNS